MDRLQNIEIFVRVAQTQSFAETARQLRISKSVVTSRVKQLEEYLGAALFHRSTRAVRLSELGHAYLRDCTELVGRANDIVDQMRDAQVSPVGSLRIHVLTGLVLGNFADTLRRFQSSYPDIQLDLIIGDAAIDPIKEGVDCALQIFPATSQDLVSRPLFPVRRVFCATDAYLKVFGTPNDPRELHNHKLGLYSGYPTKDLWAFDDGTSSLSVYLKPSLLTNSVHLLREYALNDAGIVCLPTLVASEAILKKQLTVVLPEHLLSSFSLNVVYPATSRNRFKLKLFIESITSQFNRRPIWDQDLVKHGYLPQRAVPA